MAIITTMPNGIKAGIPGPGCKDHPDRGECKGWLRGVTRRNASFLMSIIPFEMNEPCFVYMLTVRDVFESAAEFHRLVDVFRKGLYRRGVVRDHWVIEWTKAGRPHLHGMAFMGASADGMSILWDTRRHWLDITAKYGTSERGQDVGQLQSIEAWIQYASKHAARGLFYYQRQTPTLPKGWLSTGRLWGKGGQWPVDETRFDVDENTFHRFRRSIRMYFVAHARQRLINSQAFGSPDEQKAAVKRLQACRHMLRIPKKSISRVRGLGEHVPERVSLPILAALLS